MTNGFFLKMYPAAPPDKVEARRKLASVARTVALARISLSQ
jgi:hypothetical protein